MTALDPWSPLRALTAARIALGRAGAAQPTQAQLAFQLAHARARDAVQGELDAEALGRELEGALVLHSAAPDRAVYLQRPDLGRRLDAASRTRLEALPRREWDVAFVLADGLSSGAVQTHAAPLFQRVADRLRAEGWRVAPPVIVRQGRVAIGDEIGEGLRAGLVVVLIGERPGISACDSLGAYLTHAPRLGLKDVDRNCLSNIRPEGLDLPTAAHRLAYLLRESRRRGFSGVALKEEAGPPSLPG